MTPVALAWIVALPFAGALLPLMLRSSGRSLIATASAMPALGAFALLVSLGGSVFDGDTPGVSWPWLDALGLDIAFRLDGWSLLFAGLILVIGLLVILYARYYLADTDPMGRFFAVLLLFMGSMLGIALSDNLLLLILFWELTSLSSFLLIGYWQHRGDARAGARMALAITGMGGLALLAGALLLRHMTGTFTISELNEMGGVIHAHPLYPVMLVLVLIGAFTKSAQFPFHFWLPNAMAAPTPVSSYLHSATMVKAGIFLLARLYPALSGSDLWFYLVGGTGLVTLVFAAYQATFRHDIKSLLAYSTISHLGLIVLLLGLDGKLAAVAAVFHVINHATFKASLFMAAGIIDHETGTRDMRRLAGLWRHMPVTGALALVAAASMAGVPFLNGFLSKEMLFAETLSLEGTGILALVVPIAATAAGVFSVAYSTRFVHDVFFNGEPRGFAHTPHEPPRWMRVPVEVLVIVCILVGIIPNVMVGDLLYMAGTAVIGETPPEYSLAVWHGVNLPLLMSMVALGGGLAMYFWLQSRSLHAHTDAGLRGDHLFANLIRGATRLTRRLTDRTADGTLQRQVAILLGVALLAVLVPFFRGIPDWPVSTYTPMNGIAIAGWIVLAVSTVFVVAMHRQRLAAIIVLGAVGLAVAGAFAYFSAPDLALTQIVVEVATVLLLLLALPHLPASSPLDSSPRRRLRDAGLAASAGGAMAAGAWWMMTRGGSSVSAEHVARSVTEGGGTNVVNVILVDFRGFDTFGEITVLVVAAIGIVALLADRLGTPAVPATGPAEPPVMLALLTRVVLPLSVLVSMYIFLRGHNLPGGGFIAGLVTGVALVMVAAGSGRAFADQTLRVDFERLAGAGLMVAGATGIGSWFLGYPFLTSSHGHVHLPLVGDLHLATAALFDVGVFLVVVGVVARALQVMGQLGSAAPVSGRPA